MSHAFRAWIGVILLALIGCGGDTKLAPVQGRVLFHGQPLSGGTIVFTPDPERGGAGPLAMAEIGTDGKYVLQTAGKPGAVPGWHRVTVAVGGTPPGGGTLLANMPRKFTHAEQSGLCHEVKAEGGNTIDVNLE